MTSGNEGPGSVLLQHGPVLVTGNDNLYNPSTGTWTATTMPSHRVVNPLALLPNGDVWVGGGGVFGDAVYNPSTVQWTNIAPPPCTTSKQNCESAGALLNTGKVLVAGGVTYVNAQPYPIEETNGLAALFDPSTLTWTTTGSMNKSRLGETVTALLNGQVLVAGGDTFDKALGSPCPDFRRRTLHPVGFSRPWYAAPSSSRMSVFCPSCLSAAIHGERIRESKMLLKLVVWASSRTEAATKPRPSS